MMPQWDDVRLGDVGLLFVEKADFAFTNRRDDKRYEIFWVSERVVKIKVAFLPVIWNVR